MSQRLRVLTYNVLFGGEGREDRIANVIGRVDPDVVALQEAVDIGLVRHLSERLGMRMALGKPSVAGQMNLAVLSRLPVTRWRNHQHPGRMLRAHLECEVETGSSAMPRVRIHCVHLAARFGERANGEARRMRELRAILGDITRSGRTPHLLAGDFNTIAPGDTVAASAFFTRMAQLRRSGVAVSGVGALMAPLQRRGVGALVAPQQRRGDSDRLTAAGIDPDLGVGVPRLPWIVGPLTGLIPRGPGTDRFLNSLLERWTVQHLLDSGYTDCFRAIHPDDDGFTCATWMPACRIDYLFADPALAPCLVECDVVGGPRRPDAEATRASDHFPLVGEFAL